MIAMYFRTGEMVGNVALRQYLTQNLIRLMEDEKLSQKEFAKRVGFSQPTISAWLNQKVWPEPENIEKVAQAFSMEPEALLQNPNSAKSNSVNLAQDLKNMAKKLGYKLQKNLD